MYFRIFALFFLSKTRSSHPYIYTANVNNLFGTRVSFFFFFVFVIFPSQWKRRDDDVSLFGFETLRLFAEEKEKRTVIISATIYIKYSHFNLVYGLCRVVVFFFRFINITRQPYTLSVYKRQFIMTSLLL